MRPIIPDAPISSLPTVARASPSHRTRMFSERAAVCSRPPNPGPHMARSSLRLPSPLWGRHRRPSAAVLERTRCEASLCRALYARAGRGVSGPPNQTNTPLPIPPHVHFGCFRFGPIINGRTREHPSSAGGREQFVARRGPTRFRRTFVALDTRGMVPEGDNLEYSRRLSAERRRVPSIGARRPRRFRQNCPGQYGAHLAQVGGKRCGDQLFCRACRCGRRNQAVGEKVALCSMQNGIGQEP
jgi:hypothetical protein